MHDRDLYARILNIEAPWRVAEVELNEQAEEVVVRVEHDRGPLACPQCGQQARRYDTRRRHWRHLDTCEYHTILVAQMPRVLCERHKVKQVGAPWAENRSRFTMRFEAQVIDWLQEATTAAAAHQMELSWDEVDGIMQRAVERIGTPRGAGIWTGMCCTWPTGAAKGRWRSSTNSSKMSS